MAPQSGSKPATQADLKDGKAELKADVQAVREELKAVETRLDKKIDRVAMEVVKTQGQMQDLGNSLRKEMAQNTERIMNAIDAFARKGESYDRAAVLHGHAISEIQVTVKSHDKRLAALEAKK